MKGFFNNKKLITLLISFAVFMSLLLFTFKNLGTASYPQQLVNDVSATIGQVISKPVNALNNFFSDINNLQDNFEENQKLKKELDKLAETQVELGTVSKENKELKTELDLQATLTDYDLITGSVIARNPDHWIDQIIIDRGSSHGLIQGMSVMSNNGLIGRVSEVSSTSSKVTLLTAPEESSVQTSAEVILEDDSIFGVISAYDDEKNKLIMEQIISTEEIKEGNEIITSGLGGIVPRGLLVGEVSEVTLDRHGLGQRVYIEPAANFDNIRFVTIINRKTELLDEDFEERE
ncbi:MAG: rod shape-determining protein MreC [Atopostipes sp.]|nr:rod shape-determining protein MreC [Atopostipes sp.]